MTALRAKLAIAAAALAIAGCGGGDEPSTGPGGATGATGAGSASYEITAGEFLAELRPQKQRILADFVASTGACEGVQVDSGFVLLVSAAAADADPGAPFAELVEEQC